MELADLKVGMDVVVVSKKYIDDNMDRIENGYVDRVTKKFFSDDMVAKLAGKKNKITEIDADDNLLNVVVGGFWCNNAWIEKIYVAPAKPKVAPAKPSGKTAVPTKAADGSNFGYVFKKLFKKFPELGVLSTNRLSTLTHDELERICDLLGVVYDEAHHQETCRNAFDAIINA